MNILQLFHFLKTIKVSARRIFNRDIDYECMLSIKGADKNLYLDLTLDELDIFYHDELQKWNYSVNRECYIDEYIDNTLTIHIPINLKYVKEMNFKIKIKYEER